MSETIEGVTIAPGAVAAVPELSIGFSTEELVVLGRVLDVPLGFLGPAPLAAIASSAREDVLASAARSLRARNVLGGPGDLPTVDRAIAGLVQIAGRPALRVELVVDRGVTRHCRYLSIPYASVQHEVDDDGLHRLTPFATSDLLARAMRQADFVERPASDVEGFDVPFAAFDAARSAAVAGDLSGATTALVEADVAPGSAARFVDAVAARKPVHALRITHATSPTQTEGGEVAWIDGGAAGLWLLPTIDQPFAAVGATRDGLDDDAPDSGLDAAVVRVEPVAAADLASFMFGLLPSRPG